MSGINKGQFKPGSYHHNWKGGHCIDGDGYCRVLVGSGRYMKEHRLIMEWYLRRPLDSFEAVHHCNGNRADNRVDNLELTCRSEHSREHQLGRKASPQTRAKLVSMRAGTNQNEAHPQWRRDITQQAIQSALHRHKTKKEAARFLGINPDTLRARIKHYGMETINGIGQ